MPKGIHFTDFMQVVQTLMKLNPTLLNKHVNFLDASMHTYSLTVVRMQTLLHSGQFSIHALKFLHLKNWVKSNPSHLAKTDWDTLRAKLGNQRLLGMDYYSGGHLTHGYRHNVSAQMFDAYSYGVSQETGLLDYDELEKHGT